MITAPYNFVPLSEKVFYPSWSKDVSHDLPFEDGESGIIDIKITAKSPIFVRDSENEKAFCQHNGVHYIPSSSVKGMVRNVLEIMSFSKMNKENYDDDTYAVRDLSKADNFYMTEMKKPVYAGWLKKVEGEDKYVIEDCGIPGRLSHQKIDKMLNINFASHFHKEGFEKTSQYKYKLLKGKNLKGKFDGPFKSKTNAKYDTRQFYDLYGSKEGIVVFTGQPTPRKNTGKRGDGKGFEFIFFPSKEELAVTSLVFENFKFAYFDKRETEPKESPDWAYWKEKLEKGEKVPVFFQKNGNSIAHFGLSYLYKLPYKHSVKDGLPKEHFKENLDFAQTIFGYIDSKTDTSLKGRVQFSHFKTNNAIILSERTEILGTPRASYYPMYVKQYDGKNTMTFMDNNFSISGWKRYPIHKGNKVEKTEETGNENVGTTFAPLKEGVVFSGKLRYHNLKKSELGALLSALTFHDTKECFHNIGLAKPLGYGKIVVKLSIEEELQTYLKEFELQMGEQIKEWSKSEQLAELFTMATEQNNSENSQLKYMSLTEFAENKANNHLKNYSKLNNINTTTYPKSLITKEEEAVFEEKRKAYIQKLEDDKIQKKQEEKERMAEENQKKQAKKEEEQAIQKANKHQELEGKAKYAYDALQKKKGNLKQYQKEKDKFIKKWQAGKNNKGSEYILELVAKL